LFHDKEKREKGSPRLLLVNRADSVQPHHARGGRGKRRGTRPSWPFSFICANVLRRADAPDSVRRPGEGKKKKREGKERERSGEVPGNWPRDRELFVLFGITIRIPKGKRRRGRKREGVIDLSTGHDRAAPRGLGLKIVPNGRTGGKKGKNAPVGGRCSTKRTSLQGFRPAPSPGKGKEKKEDTLTREVL